MLDRTAVCRIFSAALMSFPVLSAYLIRCTLSLLLLQAVPKSETPVNGKEGQLELHPNHAVEYVLPLGDLTPGKASPVYQLYFPDP